MGRNKLLLGAGMLGLGVGLFVAGFIAGRQRPTAEVAPTVRGSGPLRVPGTRFTRPLLLCGTGAIGPSPELDALKASLASLVGREVAAGNVNAVSVFFQDMKTGRRMSINGDEQFYPASLEKIVYMIAYYRYAQSHPDALDHRYKVELPAGEDANSGQEIKPKQSVVPGGEYTAEDLIEKMIQYSDNAAYEAIANLTDPSAIRGIYDDLQISFPANPNDPNKLNYMTAANVSYFFRVLYNSTYLSDELSEKALGVMSKVDYRDGLAAGIPSGTTLSHKFGLLSISDTRRIIGRELHDCGIVYHPTDPYFLCVMTKSSSSIPSIEHAIAGVSAAVYNAVDSYSRQGI